MTIEFVVNMFGKTFVIPETVVNVWLIVIVLFIFALIVNSKVKKLKVDEKPSNFLNVIEMYVEIINNLVKDTMGKKHIKSFGPYIFTLMTFLLFANLIGLIGFTPPTSDYSVTLTLALITFTLTQFFGLKNNGFVGYLKGFTEPIALLTPLNVIGEIANPVSLSFRLFGNVMAGTLLMTLIYNAVGFFAPLVAPLPHAYFDIFSGVLQSFIFTMLTMVFIGGNLD
ncbi:ATP synthase F0 subcomplex A subunit [Keratinibaculum paraultunense]|uniref:ATP synthase subunit a n=1 Tax=Keratinibaculum paraultunense TaxID=1278232 RepID=A0A4R3KTH1_9FIRM|nr:F0F1 ATP synthase subunit A [Keratinibaculum paraultunense]QQY79182.1 F0F1 ATP synthase subunit A [Keratinibaculum paraultunense]TCS88566.1 ATP synthase F0 subcomplex A subunit [Keratinibaculum paraultunense]